MPENSFCIDGFAEILKFCIESDDEKTVLATLDIISVDHSHEELLSVWLS